MQKKVIALAVAALASSAAFAQTATNVTVYGIADVAGTIFNTGNDAASLMKNQRGFDDGAVGSRIGFKGQEDLGSGLKGEFLYELGIAPTNGVQFANANGALNNLSTRQAYVALTSAAAGQLAMGRFQTPGWDFMVGTRPWGGLDPMRTTANVHGMNINSSDRVSNAVQYTSPTWGGFKFKALYSADSKDNNTNDQDYVQPGVGAVPGRQAVWFLSPYYDNGPISLQAVYRRAEKTNDNAFDNGKYEWGVRGSYDFKVLKAGLSYQRQNLNTAVVLASGNYSMGYQYGGFVTVPIGPSFLLSLEAAKSSGNASQGGYGYMVNGQYLFSKRTSLYAQAGYMKMNNENALTLSNGVGVTNLGSYGSTPIQAGKSLTGFMAGILHTF